MKLKIVISVDRGNNYNLVLPFDAQLFIFKSIYNNPFFSEWDEMEVGYNRTKKEPFNIDKAIKALNSSQKDLWIKGYGNECEFLFSRNKLYYGIKMTFTDEVLQDRAIDFRDYMINFTISLPNFKELISIEDFSTAEIQKKYNIEQEKSIFSYLSWLNVVSPLSYNGYYNKEDLLNAPFYEVKEVAPDIVMIQAYKDPFDIENEESLNFLRSGVEYLNKNIIYLKGK